MKTLLLGLALTSFAAFATFDSTVEGLTIENTHLLDGQLILRGSQPLKKTAELKDWGIQSVLIFKNPTKLEPEKNEVLKEQQALDALGIAHHQIDFRWKNLASPELACRQVIKALDYLASNKAAGIVTYFHCTVGEDRTGLLAGMWRMLNDGFSELRAWREEMCAHGYADSNRAKPSAVATAIHQELTPLFRALAAKVRAGELNLQNLNPEVCTGLVLKPSKRTCRQPNQE